MRIVNVDPLGGPREIAATEAVVDHGEEVDVDEELAGHPPKGDPADEKYDPGAGLLAQTAVWSTPGTDVAKEAKKAKASRDAEAAKAAAASAPESAVDSADAAQEDLS